MLAQYLLDAKPTRPSRALALVDGTLERASKRHYLWEHAHGLLVRAYVLLKSDRREEALANARAALQELEKLRSEQEDIDVRIRYEDTLAYGYELVAGLTLDPRFGRISPADIEFAFSIAERMRARALLEEILARNRATAPWREEETSLQRRIRAAHEVLLDGHTSGGVRAAAVAQLRKSERQLLGLRVTEAGAPRNQPEVPTLTQVQAALRPREALISFQVWSPDAGLDSPFTDGRSWATVVTRTGIQVVQIPNADQLETRVNFFQRVLEYRDGSDRAGSAVLYALLMDSVVRALDSAVDEVILIPDGPLHRLPFDALRATPDGPFLAERFGVSLVPSAAIWLSLRNRPKAPASLALVLAQSDYGGGTSIQRAAPGKYLEDLAHSYGEGLQAVESFPRGSVLISGPAASRSALLAMDLRPFALLHFATHSLLDPVSPEKSAIVLAPGNAGDDGLLRVEDISKLSLQGKTVVLASCSTLGGVLRQSEGLMSLSRPFLGAGAQAVVGTLQPVRDAESSEFFDEFYAALEQGNSVGEALATAKRVRIAKHAAPAAWADFVLLGNGMTSPRARASRRLAMVAEMLGIAVAMGAVGLRLRRRWVRGRRSLAE
jgi:CHAT domain-containing protein